MSIILTLAAKLSTDRTVEGVKQHRIGAESLARDGRETVERVRVTRTVKAVASQPVAVAVAVLKCLALADLVTTGRLYGLNVESATLKQAEIAQDLEGVLKAQGLPSTVESLETLRTECSSAVHSAIATKALNGHKAFGPNILSILKLADVADLGNIVAAMPGAAALLAAKAKADKEAEAVKAERLAKRSANMAKLNAVKPAGFTASVRTVATEVAPKAMASVAWAG